MAQATTTVDPIPQVAGRDWRTPLELLALGAIWGSSFLFMRIAANPFGPFALVEVRLALGALVLLPFLWRERAHFRAGMWPRLAMIGAINSAIPFLLFAWAAQRSPAAIGAICNAMTVLFAALVGFLFFGQKIGTRRSLALLVGFVGVVVLATSKAGGVNLVRKHLAGIPPAAAAAATLGCAALLVLPFAATHWPTARIPPGAWGAAIAIGVVCTSYAFLLYYRLIQRIGPARASTVTYLVPLFGAGFAWAFLGEPVTLAMLAAGVLILGSVAASQRAA